MLVIGNGESRTGIDINAINDIKIGCNAIHRDFKVNHLVCVDRRMVDEAVKQSANEYALVYTREDWITHYNSKYKRIRQVPELPYIGSDRWDEPFQWGSGPYAVLLAARLAKHKVNLLGFDLYSKSKFVNNVYKDTNNYDHATKTAVDPRYWVHQISMVFQCFPNIKFSIYQEANWQLPKPWKYSNVSLDNISNIYYNT